MAAYTGGGVLSLLAGDPCIGSAISNGEYGVNPTMISSLYALETNSNGLYFTTVQDDAASRCTASMDFNSGLAEMNWIVNSYDECQSDISVYIDGTMMGTSMIVEDYMSDSVVTEALEQYEIVNARNTLSKNILAEIGGDQRTMCRFEVNMESEFMYSMMTASPAPCAPPPPSAPPIEATGAGDPHMVGGHGDKFDFKGEDGVVYALHSSRNLAVNARFEHDVYTLANKEVHGSFITETYITARTAAGDLLHIAFKASSPDVAELRVGDREMAVHISTFAVNEAATDQYEQDNIKVELRKTHMNEATLVVADGAWLTSCTARLYPYATDNKLKTRLDMSFKTVSPRADMGPVAPHGIIGQTFDHDKVAVDGAQDDYSGKLVVTKAMGEGAIEGAAADYAISGQDPYSVDFKFSRFDSIAAPVRDISKLAGVKRVATASAAASATNDEVTTATVPHA